MQKEQIKTLLEKFSNGTHTEEEHYQFVEWLKTAPKDEVDAIAEEYQFLIEAKQSGKANDGLASKIEAALDQYDLGKTTIVGRIIPLRFMRKVAVAASVILAVGLGTYLIFNRAPMPNSITETTPSKSIDVKAPETNRATITMANGQKVYLDGAANGSLGQIGNIKLVMLADGQIAYQMTEGETIKEIQYNTLFNPRGSKVIDITLADGSRVWLNAGSSITYPVAFIGDERNVSIQGEVYFEVEKNATMPFKVTVDGKQEVEVLGTHFNINAYNDEETVNTTLLEGKVKVSQPNGTNIILKPGQQTLVSEDIKIADNANLDKIMAWKDGLFNFEREDISSIMRQIGRWYDVDVKFLGQKTPKTFSGIVSRNKNISEVMKIMERAGVKISISEKTISIIQ